MGADKQILHFSTKSLVDTKLSRIASYVFFLFLGESPKLYIIIMLK